MHHVTDSLREAFAQVTAMPRSSWLIGCSWLLAAPAVAQAGMPAILLSDPARLRVQTISFFLLGFLLSAWGVQSIWNRLGREFPRLPRVGYLVALGGLTLWGLLFILVLTMISGARELMTPGAWEKAGYTYRLKADDRAPPAEPAPPEALAERRAKLETLRAALWGLAAQHGGTLPESVEAAKLYAAVWETPHAARLPYVYFGGRKLGDPAPVAAEPEIFGAERLVLCADGQLKLMTSDALEAALPAGDSPAKLKQREPTGDPAATQPSSGIAP